MWCLSLRQKKINFFSGALNYYGIMLSHILMKSNFSCVLEKEIKTDFGRQNQIWRAEVVIIDENGEKVGMTQQDA